MCSYVVCYPQYSMFYVLHFPGCLERTIVWPHVHYVLCCRSAPASLDFAVGMVSNSARSAVGSVYRLNWNEQLNYEKQQTGCETFYRRATVHMQIINIKKSMR